MIDLYLNVTYELFSLVVMHVYMFYDHVTSCIRRLALVINVGLYTTTQLRSCYRQAPRALSTIIMRLFIRYLRSLKITCFHDI